MKVPQAKCNGKLKVRCISTHQRRMQQHYIHATPLDEHRHCGIAAIYATWTHVFLTSPYTNCRNCDIGTIMTAVVSDLMVAVVPMYILQACIPFQLVLIIAGPDLLLALVLLLSTVANTCHVCMCALT